MTIEEAVKDLVKELQHLSAISSIGITNFAGMGMITIYVTDVNIIKNNELSGLSMGWKGFPILIKMTTKVVPC